MKPEKKSSLNKIILAISFFLVIALSIHCAVAWKETEIVLSAETTEMFDKLTYFFNVLQERLNNIPFALKEYNEYTPQMLLWGIFWWFVIWQTIANKGKFISGKEFGTAEWGTINDIKDLFADNIKKKELKDAQKVSNVLQRPLMWIDAHRKATRDAKKLKSILLKECGMSNAVYNLCLLLKYLHLRDEEVYKKSCEGNFKDKNGNTKKNIDYYLFFANDIRNKYQEEKNRNIERYWEPKKLKVKYEEDLKNLENGIYNEAEKTQLKEKKKKELDEARNAFFNGNVKKKKEDIENKYKNADMILTKTEHISIYNYVTNNNTLIIGGSGSGKTRGYVMPNILQAHSSYIVTDPKGEILEKSGTFLQQQGYKIRVLNLDDKLNSDNYNPFVYIHPERDGYEERVLSLIETIIVNTDGGERKGGSDPFWDKAERLFLQALFFFTVKFDKKERNMNTVMKLMEMLKIEEERDNLDSDLDYFCQIFAETYGNDYIGVQQYREFREKASGKTAKSIVISAVARLAPFRTKAVREMFDSDSMLLDRVGEEKTAIFVVVPPTDDTFNFISGMLFTQLFQELQYCATQVHKHEGQRLPVSVRFILDEFKNTCKIPNFVKILAYARSFGIGITVILQSLEQIKEMYKDEWGVIVDNCSTLLYLGNITHMDTLKYMSELIGKGTFDKRSTGRTRGRQGSSSQNFDKIGRELMTPDEVRKMPKKDCLLIVTGRNPFYSEKYDYQSHPNYRFTSDADKMNSFAYKPERNKPTTENEDTINPSERTNIKYDKIETNENILQISQNLVKGYSGLQIVSDKELLADDGTLYTGEDADALIGFFNDDYQEILSVSQETKDVLNRELNQSIEAKIADGNSVRRILNNKDDMSIVSDEDMVAKDGSEESEIQEANEYLMEEDEEEYDVLQDDTSSIQDVLNNWEPDIESDTVGPHGEDIQIDEDDY